MLRIRDDPISIATLGIFSFANKVLIGHPCTVLRRQAQVHEYALETHLTPFTLVPVICRRIIKDGFLTLWKGSIGSGMLWTMSHVTEIVIAHIFNLPRNIDQGGSRERFWRHVLLKTCTSAFMAPLYVRSFFETSGLGFDTNVFDSTVRLSMVHLIFPTATLHIAHYLVSKFTHDIVVGIARRYVSRKMPGDKTRFHAIMTEMFASVMANLVADLVCFPLETVLHRLYIQGSLALIDNLDTCTKTFRVNFKYTGILHCVRSIIRHEGILGFYKGFGTVVLQYSLQFGVLYALVSVFGWIGQLKNQNDHPFRTQMVLVSSNSGAQSIGQEYVSYIGYFSMSEKCEDYEVLETLRQNVGIKTNKSYEHFIIDYNDARLNTDAWVSLELILRNYGFVKEEISDKECTKENYDWKFIRTVSQ